ncbi:hypothetical protein ACFU0X_10105 [Streptomyces cellulosae]|uniref:Rieske domain-containing protein n=1 Tax=Streptomyces cellulosae TaxID=1968 RepID=A0ABW6JG37_STRCE
MTGPAVRHVCGAECVCPLHGTPLLYAPAANVHACQDPDCPHGHGLLVELVPVAP